MNSVQIVPLEPPHLATYYAINRAWLDAHLLYEQADEKELADPWNSIIARGGRVFVAVEGGEVIGSAAIRPSGENQVELLKLTVAENARGRGVGRQLVDACLSAAMELGATKMILVSSSLLTTALAMYRSMGFVDRPAPAVVQYKTADVFMELDLR